MSAVLLRGLAAAAAALAFAPPAGASPSVLDNGVVRVEADLDAGGRISWLSSATGRVVNLVEDAEQAYSFGYQQAGATVVEDVNDGRSLYIRAVAPGCLCTYETWLTLRGRAVHVRSRAGMHLWDDPAQWWQEVPPLYSGIKNTRVVTYDGLRPYTHASLHDVTALADFPLYQGSQHLSDDATEHWIALVGADGYGVGLVAPDVTSFVALAQPWRSYVAGVRNELFDRIGSYEYSYDLVVGSLDTIRDYAYAHRPDERPVFLFQRDRRHFTVWNARDAAAPVAGALRLASDGGDGYVESARLSFPAARVPRLYVRGAWRTSTSSARLRWTAAGAQPWDPVETFRVVPDGRFRTYRIELARSGDWRRLIQGLRLELGGPGTVDLTCISWRPCPVDVKAERRLTSARRPPLVEPFDDLRRWSVVGNTPDGTAAAVGGRLELTLLGTAVPLPGQDGTNVGVWSRCTVAGDFDVQVDYRLLEWPPDNGVHVAATLLGATLYRHNEGGSELTSWWSPPLSFDVRDDRWTGAFRFVRRRDETTGYAVDEGGRWLQIAHTRTGSSPANLGLSLWTTRSPGTAQDVRVEFDNFRVARGDVVCPSA